MRAFLGMIKRSLIVFLVYAFSYWGIAFSIHLIQNNLNRDSALNWISLIWIVAWVCHLVMSLAWIVRIQLPRFWPVAGVTAGIAALLSVPALMVVQVVKSFADLSTVLEGLGTVLLVEMTIVAPCAVLAFWLVRFHWMGRNFVEANS